MQSTCTALNRLMQRVLSVAQIREIDRVAIERFHMHSLVLMENAAIGCVRWLAERVSQSAEVVVLCGRGNNGGDGLAIARHLRVLGYTCRVVVLGPVEKMSADARANLEILVAGGSRDLLLWNDAPESDQRLESQLQLEHWLATASVVIDAMLGTGATGEPRDPLPSWINAANQKSATRIAIDVPTGWNATTGDSATAVFKADATLTFVARKPAMASTDSSRILGEIVVVPIGIPVELIEELLQAND